MPSIRGIVLHATRSGRAAYPAEARATIAYCLTPGTASYHYVVDRDGSVVELVPPGTIAWHAEELNAEWLGVALAQGVESDPITDAQHASAAYLVAKLCARYEIPRQRVRFLPTPTYFKGVTQHRDTAQGQVWGNSDIGYQLKWELIL